MIKINGWKSLPFGLYSRDYGFKQAERNARGTLIIERIATKRKIEMRWNYLDKDRLSQLQFSISCIL